MKPFDPNAFRDLFLQTLEPLSLPLLTEEKLDQMVCYVGELIRWNQIFNLTAIHELRAVARLHLADSLLVAPHIEGKRILDIGSGAGLPGIPLSVYFPEKHFVLIDSNHKKTRFLVQVQAVLGLKNVRVEHARIESFQVEAKFDTVIARAFGRLADIATVSRPLLSRKVGHILAMKGRFPTEELKDIKEEEWAIEVAQLCTLGEAMDRHLIKLYLRD